MAEEVEQRPGWIMRFVQEHPTLLLLILLAIALTTLVTVRVADANRSDRRACISDVKQQLFVLNLVYGPGGKNAAKQPIDPTLPDNVQALIRQAQEQGVEFRAFAERQAGIPPDTCKGTGVDVQKIIDNYRPFKPTATSTTTPGQRGALSSTTTSTNEARASPSTTREGSRPRSTSTTSPRSTTTSAPPTTTTTRREDPPCHVSVSDLVCVRGPSRAQSGGWWAWFSHWFRWASL